MSGADIHPVAQRTEQPRQGPSGVAGLRVLQVVPSFWPAVRYGGPIESTLQLCRHLAAAGSAITVLTTDSHGPGARVSVSTDDEVELAPGMRVRYYRKLMRNSVAPALIKNLARYAGAADLVHLTAVYNFPTIPTLMVCRRLKKPLVWSPRGALQNWPGRRRPTAKALWDRLCLKIAPAHAVVHATSAPEAESIRRALPGLNIAIVPNGITIPDAPPRPPGGSETLRLLFIGRLDPKKGLENLLAACSMLRNQDVLRFSLTIAGSGPEAYRKHLSELIQRRDLADRVQMIGEVEGDDKERAFAESDVTIVPSYIENFAIVVAEALARERPVITSHGTPWAEVERVGCGLWVENSPSALSDAIRRISTMPLPQMGDRGRRWMIEQFGWPAIARQMLACYARALSMTSGTGSAYEH
ncbi:MAG TPA: glycosyltransferase [Candidatus Binataceae bacterium]|nr:glycosyltransferase [Candidatus Binataceae bacterium]